MVPWFWLFQCNGSMDLAPPMENGSMVLAPPMVNVPMDMAGIGFSIDQLAL